MQKTRDNHFVQRAYLSRWTDGEGRLWRYRLLVPHARVKYWKQCVPAQVAYRRDLYTTIADEGEMDEFERWVESEFETPAQEAIGRAVSGRRLHSKDIERLARYAVVQDLRTPQAYREITDLFARSFDRVADDLLADLKHLLEAGIPPEHSEPDTAGHDQDPLRDSIKVTVTPDAYPERGEGEIRVEGLAGRKHWLDEIRRLVEGPLRVVLDHSWSIVEPSNGVELFTSDHPVVRMNHYGDGRFDVRGGWAQQRGDIFMPLSTTHMLFTEVGARLPQRFQLTPQQTQLLQRAQAVRAHLEIYAQHKNPEITSHRRRVVDAEACRAHRHSCENWNQEQRQAEQEFRSQS